MAVRNFGPILDGVMWAQVVLAIIFIGLRMYTRQYIIRCVGWDDIIMLVNFLTFIGYVTCISVGVRYGIGRKVADVPSMADYSKAIQWEAIGQGICILGIAASKSSVALFLLRIVIKKWHIAVLWAIIALTTILCIITTTLLFLQCKPAAFLWDRTIEGGVCWLDFEKVGLTMGSWSAAMDFILAILPWHIIMGLNMKRKEKLTVAFGLSLGVLAGICSVVRTYELQSLASQEEYVYDTVPMLLWSSTEVLVTIICACIPVLRPLYVRIMYGSRGDSSGGRSYGRKGSNNMIIELGHNSGGHSKLKSDISSGGHRRGPSIGTGPALKKNTSEESILRDDVDGDRVTGFEGWGEGIKRTDEIVLSSTTGRPGTAQHPGAGNGFKFQTSPV